VKVVILAVGGLTALILALGAGLLPAYKKLVAFRGGTDVIMFPGTHSDPGAWIYLAIGLTLFALAMYLLILAGRATRASDAKTS